MAAQQQQPSEEVETKPDVKPRRLATTYLGPPGLLRMIGSGDKEHIITRVIPGTDPLQALLSDVAAQHQRMAASLDALASRVEDMIGGAG